MVRPGGVLERLGSVLAAARRVVAPFWKRLGASWERLGVQSGSLLRNKNRKNDARSRDQKIEKKLIEK